MGFVLPYLSLTRAIWCNTPKSTGVALADHNTPFSAILNGMMSSQVNISLEAMFWPSQNFKKWTLHLYKWGQTSSCFISISSWRNRAFANRGQAQFHSDPKGADLFPSCHVELYLHRNFISSLCCWKRQGEDTGKLCWEVILRGHQAHLSTDYCQRKGHLAFLSTWATFRNISAFCICGSKVSAQISYSNGYIDYLPQILPCNANSMTHNYRLLGTTASNMRSCVLQLHLNHRENCYINTAVVTLRNLCLVKNFHATEQSP